MKLHLISGAFLCNCCFAQDSLQSIKRNPLSELNVSVGWFTTGQFQTGITDFNFNRKMRVYLHEKEIGMAPYLFNETRPFQYYNWRRTGSLNLKYQHQIIPRLSGSISFSFEQNKCDIGYGYSGQGYRNINALTLSAGVRLRYYQYRGIELYGVAEGGITRVTNKYVSLLKNVSIADPTTYSLEGQITPLGIRIGKRIAGFAEFGFGIKGLIQVGCSFRP